jgi:hypothetical protein
VSELDAPGPSNPDIGNIIRRALGDAKRAGIDDLGQVTFAVEVVRLARPDMNDSEARAAVNTILWGSE